MTPRAFVSPFHNAPTTQAQDYYGNAPNFVPTVGLDVIQSFVDKTLFPSLRVVEDEYAKLKNEA